MARGTPTTIPLALSLLIFIFLFTLAHARHVPEPESESATEIQTSKSKPYQQDTVSFSVDSADPVPLTVLTLRPFGRHLPARHQLPSQVTSSLRFGRRRCRHGHRREISYGNDAIVHSPGVAVDHLIPARWVMIRHGQPRITEIPRFDRHLDHHNHHHHRHGEKEGKKKKQHESWFVKKIRNFFNLF